MTAFSSINRRPSHNLTPQKPSTAIIQKWVDYCQCFSDSWIFFFIPLISSYYAQLFLNQPDSLEHVVYWLGVWICTRRLHECCSLCAYLSQLCYLHLQQSLQHFGFKPSMPKQPSCQASKKQTNRQTNKVCHDVACGISVQTLDPILFTTYYSQIYSWKKNPGLTSTAYTWQLLCLLCQLKLCWKLYSTQFISKLPK